MYRAIQEIHDQFDKVGIKHRVDQMGDKWLIHTGMGGKASTYQFLYVKTDNSGNDVAVRSTPIAHFPREKYGVAHELLNCFQQEYRFAKFVLDNDGDVIVEYDFPVTYEPIGEGAVEILLRFTKILDECYPKLMRELWK